MSWVNWSSQSPRVTGALLFLLISMGWVGQSQAQNHTPDPYKPYNQLYEQFVYPTFPTGYGLVPNQSVLEGRGGYRGGGANQFQRFMELEGDSVDEFGESRRRSGPGVPYYSAYRQYDREYDRIYKANRKSDEGYNEDKNARHDKYVAYLKERDPQKRAQLYREYVNDTRRVSRDLANPRSQVSRRESATAKPEDRAPAARTRRGSAGTAPAARSNRSPLFGSTRPGASATPNERPKKPSEVLREYEELESSPRSRTLTAPGLTPRSGSSRPRE